MAKSLFKKIIYKGLETLQRFRYGISKRPDYRRQKDFLLGERLQKITWPKNYQAVVNIQLDDFCLKSGSDELDYGGIPEKGVNKTFFDALKKIPYAKVTLFTIPAPRYKHLGLYNEKYSESKFSIANPEHKKWIQWVKSFKNIEIANHGLHHYQEDAKYLHPFAEFLVKNEYQSLITLLRAKKLFALTKIPITGTRPPAYELGRNFSFIEAAKKTGFTYIAASTPIYGLNLFRRRVSNIYPQKYNGMLNLPGNLSLHQPLSETKEQIDKMISMGGLITLRGHYVQGTELMANGVDDKTMKNMIETIQYINKTYPKKIWFAKLSEIADWYNKNAK